MSLEEYTIFSRTTAIYPKDRALDYLGLGLCSEAGEVAGKLKKKIRDGGVDVMTVLDEVGDVFWYAVRLCDELGVSPETVIQRNWMKLKDRQERNVLGGSGDKR